jgi:hypothetical protein
MGRIGTFMITGCLAAYIVSSPSLAQERYPGGGSSPGAPSTIRETRRVEVVPAKQPGSPLASAPVGAEWVKVSDSFANAVFVDPSTIKRVPRTEKSEADEDIRTATEMLDFKLKTPDGPASYISVSEYDCKNRKARTKSGNAYAGQAGTGKILLAVTPSDWTRQPANSPGTPILTYVCSKALPPLPTPSKSARGPR